MYRLLVVSTLLAVTFAANIKSSAICQPFSNVKATIYTGSENDPQDIIVNSLSDLKEAYKIEIDNQNIPHLCEESFGNLKRLDTLTIKNSKISSLAPDAFKGSDELRTLDLSGNSIKRLPHGVFNHLNIRRVNLTGNAFSDIDSSAFDDMPKLQTVELGDNQITTMDSEWFNNSPMVYRLVLDKNAIKTLPKDALGNLAKSAERKQKIQLWLSENQIKDIHPQAFRKIDEIDSLWLDKNKISELENGVFKGIRIGTLALNENQLTCLSDSFLSKLTVKDLMIDVNPMDCDCLRGLRKWATKNRVDMTAIRRGLECARTSIDKAFKAQKQYYEEQLEMERKF